MWRCFWQTWDFLLRMLPGALLAAALFALLLPLRRRRLAVEKLDSPPLREAALCFFGMFSGGLALLTLTPGWFDWRGVLLRGDWEPFFKLGSVNLMPFRSFGQLYILAGNLLMFLPFGFFPQLLFRRGSWKRALCLGFAVTAFIECWQLAVGRAFDVDDLMVNTLGTLVGYWLALPLERFAPRFRVRPNDRKN